MGGCQYTVLNQCTDSATKTITVQTLYAGNCIIVTSIFNLHLAKDDESLVKQNISSEWFTSDGLVGAALTELVRMSEKQ